MNFTVVGRRSQRASTYVRVLVAVALLPLIALVARSRAQVPATSLPTAPAVEDRRGWPEVVRLGVVPIEGGADSQKRFVPMQEHLTRELNVRVEVISASNYQGVITAMGNDQLEFAYLGPKSYIEAAKRAKAQALLVELNKERERGYRAIFIVPKSSEIKTIGDARGRRFAFTDPNSTSGKTVPAAILFEEFGVAPDAYFSKVTYSGSHGTSILQVAAGEIDVAATNDLDLAKIIDKGAVKAEDVRVIFTSELIPGSPFAARSDIPASLKQAFVAAMLKLNGDKVLLEHFQCGGYEPVEDAEYDVVRMTDAVVKAREATR